MTVLSDSPLSALNRIPPHLVRRDALPAEAHRALLAWALASAEVFHQPGAIEGDRVAPEIRNNRTCASEHARTWRRQLRGHLKPLLIDVASGLGVAVTPDDRLELEITSYGGGCFYRRHIDTRVGPNDAGKLRPSNRILSAVYYFHRQPRGFSGGELRLSPIHPRSEGMFLDVPVEDNMLLAFPSWAPHEVRPVLCPSGAFADSRFAMNCWVHRTKPGAEPARDESRAS